MPWRLIFLVLSAILFLLAGLGIASDQRLKLGWLGGAALACSFMATSGG